MRTITYHAAICFCLAIVIAPTVFGSIPTTGQPVKVGSITDVADDHLASAVSSHASNGSIVVSQNSQRERPSIVRRPQNPISQSFRTRLKTNIHSLVNQERREKGLPPLAFDDRLAAIAGSHSREMARNGFVAHTAPNGDTVIDRYQQGGYTCRVNTGDGSYLTAGENIFMASMTGNAATPSGLANRTVSGWMSSPGHRRNVLNPSWGVEGIGVYTTRQNGDLEVYVTQNFC